MRAVRAVIQRVGRASVSWEDGRSEIGPGALVLLGVGKGDDEVAARWLAEKCIALRMFGDEEGRMNRSLLEVEGELLVVSQFTLYGDCRKGRRPSYDDAAPPDRAEALYEAFLRALKRPGLTVRSGSFGAMMQVELVNEGPVTLIVDSP